MATKKTTKKIKRKKIYRLVVSYPVALYAWGSLDDRLERLARRDADGHGTGFGLRDSDFTFEKPAERDAAIKRIKATKLLGLKYYKYNYFENRY